MKDTIFLKLIIVILVFCFAYSSTFPTQAQSITIEKPKIKDFGISIKQKKEAKVGSSKNKSENSKKVNEIEDVIKIETRLVRTDVLVTDQRGKAILGLKASDFLVTENNIPQEIGTFSLGGNTEVPRSIVLIIDYSSSQSPYIRDSVEAAKLLIDKLNPKDSMAIATDDIKLIAEFTRDKRLLKEKLDSLPKKVHSGNYGDSLQYSTLMATLNEMFDEEDIRPIIIFQTDGDEALSIPKNQLNAKQKTYDKKFTVADLFETIEKSRATIYSVIVGRLLLGLSPEERLNTVKTLPQAQKFQLYSLEDNAKIIYAEQSSMVEVAGASGAFTLNLQKPEQANEIYSKILEDINNRYLIGYYPSNLAQDGKRRNVKIEVRGHPEYVVTGRKTYFAPDVEK